MNFKSKTQPLCRFCGKRIAKATDKVTFGAACSRYKELKPKTRAEVQRVVNGEIVSFKWAMTTPADYDGSHSYRHEHLTVRDYIEQISVWDGESYVDQFFCNGDHARRFGYAAARAGYIIKL